MAPALLTTPPARTSIVALPLTVPALAVIVAEPGATAVTVPFDVTVAMAALDVVHENVALATSLPATVVARAVNCCAAPGTSEADAGETATMPMDGGGVVAGASLPLPHAAAARSEQARRS
ncbi:MAG: hypothetical protein AMXMBFR55_04010 [Gemmatimonadota bacterium]